MVAQVADSVAPLIHKNRNTLTVWCADDVGAMHGDASKTRQILFNLLSNAGQSTTDGYVVLQVTRDTRSGRPCVAFSVTDTGSGMTDPEIRMLSESCECHLMGGTIVATSYPGEGSRCVARLPAETVDTASIAPRRDTVSHLARTR